MTTLPALWARSEPNDRIMLVVEQLRNLRPDHDWIYKQVGGPGYRLIMERHGGPFLSYSDDHCGSAGCAIGLITTVFGDFDAYDYVLHDQLGMGETAFGVIFWGTTLADGQFNYVTPDDVADALEHYLVTGEAVLEPTGGDAFYDRTCQIAIENFNDV